MAISGAFGAGFVSGFADSLEKGIDERKARMNTLIDNQMDAVRRTAPKVAKSMAESKNAQIIMEEMKAEFGVSDAEFIALAQSYDINAVYGAIQKAQAALPEGSKLDKSQFLGSLNIPKGTSLPEGMTAEQALESIYLGYARNINEKPDDKSETHKSTSWGKALKNTLMLDPRASAEEQLEAMSYMGMPVQDVLQFEASQGQSYEPIQGVERVRGFDIETTDYKERDYMSTASTYERTFTRTFAGTDDLANVTNMEEALNAIGAKDKSDLGNRLRKGGTAIAELELSLSQRGMQSKLARDQVLLKLSNEVNTASEMDNLLSAVDDGKAQELIMESMQKNGRLTNEYIEYILTGVMPAEEDKIVEEPVVTPEPDDLEQAGVEQEEGAVPEETSTGDATVDAILANAAGEEVEKTTDALVERPEPEPSMAEKEYTSAAQFIADNSNTILDHLENDGITGGSSKEDIKKSLNAFYQANQDDPSIGDYIANADILDIDRIADVFKLTLKNLEEE